MASPPRPAYDDCVLRRRSDAPRPRGRRGAPVALIAVVAAACAQPASRPPLAHRAPGADPAGPEVPDEVAALIARWESCQHWAGEEPYDDERRREIAAGVAASCPGNDETRARLLETYADRPDIVRRLRDLPE
jgi:hypothetical protein